MIFRAIVLAPMIFACVAPPAVAWKIDGAVVTQEYWPIYGATVQIASLPDGIVSESCSTDDLGNFHFKGDIPDGTYRISVTHPDFLPAANSEAITSDRTVFIQMPAGIPRKLP